MNNKSLEKDIVTGLQARKDKMVMEADNLVNGIVESSPRTNCIKKQLTVTVISAIYGKVFPGLVVNLN